MNKSASPPTKCADPQAILSSMVIVLHRPQDVVNIGGVVRAMKNMGFQQLRLVDPAPFAASDITGIAHRSEDILEGVRTYTDLDAALADACYVVGTTARLRGQHPICTDLRAVVPDILHHTAHGTVALLFGPEDNGLDSIALDRCHTIIRIPTAAAYPSLNLAQAALLLMYELRLAALGSLPTQPDHRSPATVAQLELLFQVWEQALHGVGFFKTVHVQTVMRPFRSLIYRALPDQRETALLTAMAREISKFIKRTSS